jgi:hypothetical protein
MSKTVEVYKAEIENELNRMIDLVDGTQENQVYWKPSAEEWSIIEVLSHVEEAVSYWVGELQRVIQSPGVDWGRGLNDEARLAAVSQAHNQSFTEVREGMSKAKAKTIAAFNVFKQEDIAIESPHRNPKFGVKNMHFLVQHFLVEHLQSHNNQIKRVLKQYQENH